MAADAQNSPFIKHLASSDKETRDQALESLRTFLSGRREIPELDLLKLWKGLFYCLWMQDKPQLQQSLSRDLASLPSTLQPTVVLPFLRAFWLTMAREWTNIEALRLDKYLYLIRQYTFASFKWLSHKNWTGSEAISEYMQVLSEIPLSPVDLKVPNGLRFHVLDVYLDEMERAEKGWGEEKLRDVAITLLGPVTKLATEGKLKVMRTAAKEVLDDERARSWMGLPADEEGDEGENDDEEWGGIED